MASGSLADQVRRPYRSRARQRQAEETRRRILEAARELLLRRGYAGTTLEMIAEVAEVSPKTVSAIFGSKRGILAALMSPTAFGGRVQQLLGRLRVASDPLQRVQLVAQMTRQIYESLAPEFDLLRGAGTVAPELADLARQIEARRRQNVALLVTYLEDQHVLRLGVAPEEAADVLWALTSYDLYRMLVGEVGWTLDRYEVWLAELLRERLLFDPQPGGVPTASAGPTSGRRRLARRTSHAAQPDTHRRPPAL